MVSPNSAEEVAHNFEVHLLAWQHLAARCEGLNLRLYKLRPKHHYFDHIGEDVQRTRLNMWKLASCNNDESFLGYLKRLGSVAIKPVWCKDSFKDICFSCLSDGMMLNLTDASMG